MDLKKAVRRDTTQDDERTSVRIRADRSSSRVGERKSAVEQSAFGRRFEDENRYEDGGPDSTCPSEGGIFSADEERATTLVLMESGAFWPAWVKEVQRRAPNSMVEVQSASESVEGFGGRALRRLASLRERGVSLRAAVYAAASPATEQERAVRRVVCGMLLDVLGHGGELVLSGEGWSTWGMDARSREELMSLAGELSCQLPRASSIPPQPSSSDRDSSSRISVPPSRRVTVSVRFGDPPDESGVHKAARSVDSSDDRASLVRRTEGVVEQLDDEDLAREIA